MSSTKHDVVSILGGGWSAIFVDRDGLPGTVIGVNDSAVLARCHGAVSMDRLWTEYRWPYLVKLGRQALIRTSALKNIPQPRPAWLRPFECDYKSSKFTDQEGWLNGTNSGACAINWGWKLKPRRLYLFGFDMNRSPNGAAYWYPPYPWTEAEGATKPGKYKEWTAQFSQIADQLAAANIEVLNVSATSSLDCFRKITPADLQKEMP